MISKLSDSQIHLNKQQKLLLTLKMCDKKKIPDKMESLNKNINGQTSPSRGDTPLIVVNDQIIINLALFWYFTQVHNVPKHN